MKATCKYTGLELLSSSGFARWAVISEHPIFAVPLDTLIKLAADSWSPEMFVLDKKLLFLAIAKNCELISWRENHSIIPAKPTPAVIESCIEPLLQIAGWIDFQRFYNKFAGYPSLLITEETYEMQTFQPMLISIINSRDVTEKQERREHRLICLENNAKNLSAKCRIGANKETALLRTTAEWAIAVTEEALNAGMWEMEIREQWKEMLQTSASRLKAKGFSIDDVMDCQDFMTDNLPHGSVIAHDVIAHLHRLIAVNSFSDIDGGVILGARILQQGTLSAIETEPQREQFASLLEYARTRAQWLLQQRQKEETANELERINKQQQRMQALEGQSDDDI